MISRYFHVPSRSYEGAEERDAGIYDVSIKIILIFVTQPCIQSVSYVCYISQNEIHLKINEKPSSSIKLVYSFTFRTKLQ